MTTRDSLIVALVALVALGGCTQKTASTEPPAPPTVAEPPAAPAAPAAAPEPSPPSDSPAGSVPRSVTGAPAPTPASRVAAVAVSVDEFTEEPALQDVFFGPGSADIGGSGARFMKENARWLLENPSYLVLIEGHSDYKGTGEANLLMGERRAKAAARLLVREGVPDTRLWTISYGSANPVCEEKTDACAARNRRVHFLVKKP